MLIEILVHSAGYSSYFLALFSVTECFDTMCQCLPYREEARPLQYAIQNNGATIAGEPAKRGKNGRRIAKQRDEG